MLKSPKRPLKNHPKPKGSNYKYKKKGSSQFSGYLYTMPFFVIFGIFGIFPMVFTAYISFFSWNILGEKEFIGLQNYIWLFDDPLFWQSVLNTFSIWILSTVPQVLLSLVIAVLLNAAILKGKNFFRVAILMPNVTSVVAVGIIFTAIFGTHYGIFNYLITLIGFDAIDWKNSMFGTHFVIASMVNWRYVGYGSLIFLAGLQSISKEFIEAAKLDGANAFQQFFLITIPLLRPVIIFKVILMTINGMQIFAEPLLFSGGGGGGMSYGLTITLLLYEEAFTGQAFGYASAVAWVLFMIIVIFSIINFLLTRKLSSTD